jgi:hypothetical protein
MLATHLLNAFHVLERGLQAIGCHTQRGDGRVTRRLCRRSVLLGGRTGMLRRSALLLSGDPITLGRFARNFRDLSPTLGVVLIAQAACRIFSHGSFATFVSQQRSLRPAVEMFQIAQSLMSSLHAKV